MEETENRIYRKKEKAQGMVEFALTLPILLLLFFGIIEFGRLLFYYSAVVTATREAARYGSAAGGFNGVGNYYQDCNGIRSAAKRIGGIVGIADTDIQIQYSHGPDPTKPFDPKSEQIFANACSSTIKVIKGDRIIVTVTGRFQPIVPLVNVPSINITSVARRSILTDLVIISK